MKSIEEMYDKHVISERCRKEILTPYDLVLNIDEVVSMIEDQEKEVLSDHKKNVIAQKVKNNPFLSWLEGRDFSLLEEDGSLLEELFDWMERCLDLLVFIVEGLTEDNFLEMLKLCDFLVDAYVENHQFLDGQRRAVSYASQGIRYQDNRYFDTREEVSQFVLQKLGKKTVENPLEKKKEM